MPHSAQMEAVMAGLVPAIHVFPFIAKAWMPATGAGMTEAGA